MNFFKDFLNGNFQMQSNGKPKESQTYFKNVIFIRLQVIYCV
jgi:hypothetical protein